MAQSRIISETPSNTALKKAKYTAAKDKQDLTKEFSTATNADVQTPDLDDVVKSPTRIPRRFEPTHTSSPDLSVLPAQFIPATITTMPPATVIIPAQTCNPLPVQPTADLLRANLVVPTIHSRLDYEHLPINFAYLINIKYCSIEDKMKTHIELLSKNRRQRRRIARKIKELAAKDENLKVKKPEEQYRRDAIDQKIFTATFSRKDSHNFFGEDLRTETLTRRSWRELIKVSNNEFELNLLDKYIILTYKDLASAKQMRPTNKTSTTRNMYIET